jgi:ubiquinone/menaquinone biosynthesis C-methylase UbiE
LDVQLPYLFHEENGAVGMISRWDEWFSESNLAKDRRILAAPPSKCAETAALEFLAKGKGFILDLACGIGRDTFCLESHGLSVIGADAAFNGLRIAQQAISERGAGTELVAADARHLPFKDGSLEGVYCYGLLHEFTSEHREEDVEQVMAEIVRLLCDEGILVLTALSGEPQAGLPAVQLFTRQMFERATQGLQAVEIKLYDDVGCTGRPDYHIWYGVFEK